MVGECLIFLSALKIVVSPPLILMAPRAVSLYAKHCINIQEVTAPASNSLQNKQKVSGKEGEKKKKKS